MKCPHCLIDFHAAWKKDRLGTDVDSLIFVNSTTCPACERFVIALQRKFQRSHMVSATEYHYNKEMCVLVYPKAYSRAQLGPDVPAEFADDYNEACVTLADSPKASAALSRRCLQHLLREKAGIQKRTLADEIEEAIKSAGLPSHLNDSLDAVRNVGNFAAHPMKSTASGEVMDVEPGEAEWTLDVLESLFDFYFTQPALLKKKRDALNAKLQEAGKPPMK